MFELSEEMRKTLEAFMLNMFKISRAGQVESGIREKGKFGYLMGRIFPGVEFMKKYKPIFGRRWLLPVGWIYRAFDIMFTRLGKSIREMKMVARSKETKIDDE